MTYKFKIGDRVKSKIECSRINVGDIGTVQENAHCPYVKWDRVVDGRSTWATYEGNLELIKEETKVSKFKVGDKVMILENDVCATTGEATIIRIDTYGNHWFTKEGYSEGFEQAVSEDKIELLVRKEDFSPKLTFMEAVKLMKEGKKVKSLITDVVYYLENGCPYRNFYSTMCDEEETLNLEEIEGGWELVEPKKVMKYKFAYVKGGYIQESPNYYIDINGFFLAFPDYRGKSWPMRLDHTAKEFEV